MKMIDVAVKNGISRNLYRARLKIGWSEERAATERVNDYSGYKGDYAVYKGEEIIAIGTAEECAEMLNVSVDYIRWMTTPSGIKRLASRKNQDRTTTAIKLDDDEK